MQAILQASAVTVRQRASVTVIQVLVVLWTANIGSINKVQVCSCDAVDERNTWEHTDLGVVCV